MYLTKDQFKELESLSEEEYADYIGKVFCNLYSVEERRKLFNLNSVISADYKTGIGTIAFNFPISIKLDVKEDEYVFIFERTQ